MLYDGVVVGRVCDNRNREIRMSTGCSQQGGDSERSDIPRDVTEEHKDRAQDPAVLWLLLLGRSSGRSP